jgi:hypothetical protein
MIKPRIIRWEGHVERMREINEHKILIGKPTGKRPSGRPSRRQEENIKMGF